MITHEQTDALIPEVPFIPAGRQSISAELAPPGSAYVNGVLSEPIKSLDSNSCGLSNMSDGVSLVLDSLNTFDCLRDKVLQMQAKLSALKLIMKNDKNSQMDESIIHSVMDNPHEVRDAALNVKSKTSENDSSVFLKKLDKNQEFSTDSHMDATLNIPCPVGQNYVRKISERSEHTRPPSDAICCEELGNKLNDKIPCFSEESLENLGPECCSSIMCPPAGPAGELELLLYESIQPSGGNPSTELNLSEGLAVIKHSACFPGTIDSQGNTQPSGGRLMNFMDSTTGPANVKASKVDAFNEVDTISTCQPCAGTNMDCKVYQCSQCDVIYMHNETSFHHHTKQIPEIPEYGQLPECDSPESDLPENDNFASFTSSASSCGKFCRDSTCHKCKIKHLPKHNLLPCLDCSGKYTNEDHISPHTERDTSSSLCYPG